ncbi:hypothetical protein E2C01_097658 [Portunus trituberculatus]|uniref:Uncharacterized protein n=1 Tax=Portunus trituberculatus TaxID=210409 RepID=A0A5B7K502_PORTR|nr:hypothetical protein [Portunus trituberculatus]
MEIFFQVEEDDREIYRCILTAGNYSVTSAFAYLLFAAPNGEPAIFKQHIDESCVTTHYLLFFCRAIARRHEGLPTLSV